MILVLSNMKFPYPISKVVVFYLFEVHVSYTVEVHSITLVVVLPLSLLPFSM